MEKSLLALFAIVLLFLGIMPALLYLVGWAAKRYTDQTPVWIHYPLPRRQLGDLAQGEAPERVEA
jgi:hypothetical protein